jgi:hypothetical protein
MQLVNAAITVEAAMLQQCLQSLPVVAVRVGKEAVGSKSMQADLEQAADTNLYFPRCMLPRSMRCNVEFSKIP